MKIEIKTTEAAFKKRVVRWLRANNIFYWSTDGAKVRGIPDIMAIRNRNFFAFELKRSHKEAIKKDARTTCQRNFLRKLSGGGGMGLFVYPENFGRVCEFLEDALTRPCSVKELHKDFILENHDG